MATPTYNPSNQIVTWNNILFQGEMDGEWVTIEFQSDRRTLHVGTRGATTYVDNADQSAIATIMLAQSSPTNARLTAALDEKGPFQFKDLDTGELVEAADTKIQKHTPIKRGKELIGYEWKLILPKAVVTPGAGQ